MVRFSQKQKRPAGETLSGNATHSCASHESSASIPKAALPRRMGSDGATAARHGFAPLIASLCRPPVRERMPRDIRTELGRPQLSEFGRPGGGPAGAKRRSVGISMPGRIRAVPPSCWSLAMPPLLSPLSVPESWHQQDIRVCLSSLPARCLASTGALDGERSGQ